MERSRKLFLVELCLSVIALLFIVYLSLFYKLGAGSLNIWDEARLAVSALEMSQTGHWLIPTYDFKPDMWNVKPPLMIILEAMAMKSLGFNELAVRLPTAIAAFATLALLFWFCVRQLNSLLVGFCSVLFLCTSPGYVSLHVARTGDYDTLLILFLVAYFLSAFTFLKTRKYSHYLLFCLFLLLALFTKGIAAGFFLPGVFIMFLLDKDFRKEALSLRYVLPLAVAACCITSYYLLREAYTPGYIRAVFYWEIRGRLFNPEFYTHDPWYAYFARLVNSDFSPWWILIPLALPAFFKSNLTEKDLIKGISLTLLIFWIPLTISINKYFWYGAPALPLLSLMAAITFSKISLYFFEGIKNKRYRRAAVIVLLFSIGVMPVYNAFSRADPAKFAKQQEVEQKTMLRQDVALATLIRSNRIPNNTKIISSVYNSPLDFYRKALAVRGIHITFLHPQQDALERKSLVINTDGIEEGDTVLALSKAESDAVTQKFHCDVIYSFKELQLLAVKERNR